MFSGANADREILFFFAQLTTSRIDNLTRLIHTRAICVTVLNVWGGLGKGIMQNFQLMGIALWIVTIKKRGKNVVRRCRG